MPSAAQKQRRRKLKQKKERVNSRDSREDREWQANQERVRAAMIHAARWWGNNESSDRDRFHQFISPLHVAFDSAACERGPLDEGTIKNYMMIAIRDDIARDELIEDIEQYAGCISHATAAYNSTAPAAPSPAPVAKTAEELRRRAKYLTKKLNETSSLQSRVDAGHDPCAQEVEKLALRSERENELAAVMEALAVLPPESASTTSSDEATVPDSAAPVLAAAPPAPSTTPSDVQQGDVELERAREAMDRAMNRVHELAGLMNAPGGAAALAHALQARENAPRAARDDIYDSDDEDRDVARRLQGARDQERREREAVPTMGGSWVCTACTFENPNPNALVCDLCNTVRPVAA